MFSWIAIGFEMRKLSGSKSCMQVKPKVHDFRAGDDPRKLKKLELAPDRTDMSVSQRGQAAFTWT